MSSASSTPTVKAPRPKKRMKKPLGVAISATTNAKPPASHSHHSICTGLYEHTDALVQGFKEFKQFKEFTEL